MEESIVHSNLSLKDGTSDEKLNRLKDFIMLG